MIFWCTQCFCSVLPVIVNNKPDIYTEFFLNLVNRGQKWIFNSRDGFPIEEEKNNMNTIHIIYKITSFGGS